MTIHFCNSRIIDNAIYDLIQKQITPGLSPNEIKLFYTEWKENFDTDNDDHIISNKIINPEFNIFNTKSQVGIDYPAWFNLSLNSKKIMILGIDPLRNTDAFKEADINTQCLIGTPYALHRKSMREGKDGNSKSYWKFIKPLLEKNYSIYLTDIFKVYYVNQNTRSYNDKDFIKRGIHLEILKQEIEIVKPNLIIVLGNKPLQLLDKSEIRLTEKISKQFYNETLILPMVHLSGMAGKGRKKFIANNLDEISLNDIDSYLKIVDNYIEMNG